MCYVSLQRHHVGWHIYVSLYVWIHMLRKFTYIYVMHKFPCVLCQFTYIYIMHIGIYAYYAGLYIKLVCARWKNVGMTM